jgi:hypothetical protein
MRALKKMAMPAELNAATVVAGIGKSNDEDASARADMRLGR